MRTPRPTIAHKGVARLLEKAPPPLFPDVFAGDARLTARWTHEEFHGYVPGMAGHIIGAYYGNQEDSSCQVGNKRLAARVGPGTICVIPDAHDGVWHLAGPIEVSHVYLTDERVQSCADMISNGRRVELLHRVGFVDPTGSRLQELLSHEAMTADVSQRLFMEQLIDLLCLQLLRAHSSVAPPSEAGARRGLAPWQVKRVMTFMQ
jgi:AraC family transcriptional regulator